MEYGPNSRVSTGSNAAEFYVVDLLQQNRDLEVFRGTSRPRTGPELAVRSRRTGRWYSVLVQPTGGASDAFLEEASYRPAGDLLVAVVVLGPGGAPERAYLVRGSEWADECTMPRCLIRDHGQDLGQSPAGPHVGLRTGDPAHRAELDLWYSAELVTSTL